MPYSQKFDQEKLELPRAQNSQHVVYIALASQPGKNTILRTEEYNKNTILQEYKNTILQEYNITRILQEYNITRIQYYNITRIQYYELQYYEEYNITNYIDFLGLIV